MTMKLSLKNVKILAFLSLILLLLTSILFYVEGELTRPWKQYQRGFNELDSRITAEEIEILSKQPNSAESKERLNLLVQSKEKADCRPLAIKQIWLPELGITDRCTSCHLGMESSRFANEEQPFTTHPGKHITADHHPVDKFACVTCHDGQGVALSVAEAHAETDIWLRPILRGELAESSCRNCHIYDDKVPQHLQFPEAPHLTNGKALYLEKGCLGCHLLKGFDKPQHLAPNLTRTNEKVTNQWMEQWINKPKSHLPLTIMPFFDLKEEQIHQLGAYLTATPVLEKSAKPISGDVERGKKLLETVGCLACHSIGETTVTFGPDLSRVAEKFVNETWILDWIADPAGYDAETEMPNFRLDEQQIQDISSYILTLKKETAGAPLLFASELAEKGKELFVTLGCTGCHKKDGVVYGFQQSPEHTGLADKEMDMFDFGHVTDIAKTKAAWIQKKLEEPRAFSTDSIKLLMPDFELTTEEIRDLRVWLFSLKKHEAPASFQHKFWNTNDPFITGMRTVEKYNCTGCHKIGLSTRRMPIDDNFPEGYFWSAKTYALDDINVDDTLLYSKGTALTDARVSSLLTKNPEMDTLLFNKRWFVDYDSVGYLMDMEIKEMEIVGMDEGDIMSNYKGLNFAPPILHYEGAKVQANWLHDFLNTPYPIRPLVKATMPSFKFSEDEKKDLVAFFTAKEGLDHPYFEVHELNAKETETAEKVFKLCLQCHYFNQTRLADKKEFGDLKGPNLAEVKRRLRPEYIKQWVKYPDLMIPGTQMKNFFFDFNIDDRFVEIDGDETGIRDVSQKEKIEMMSRFLMNPYKNSKLSIQR
jgi:mono/diheme cytochrome c family protein